MGQDGCRERIKQNNSVEIEIVSSFFIRSYIEQLDAFEEGSIL